VLWLVPMRDDEREGAYLQFLESGLLGTPELASLEARRGVEEMFGVCRTAFSQLGEIIANPEKKLGNLVDEIKKEEQRTDEMEEEIIGFCSELARSGTSARVGREVARYLEMANDIERIGDHCTNLVLLAQRRFDKSYQFGEEAQAELDEMMALVSEIVEVTHGGLAPDARAPVADAKVQEAKINKLRDKTRKRHADRMQKGDVDVRSGIIFLDMMTNMEKIGDYCWNVVNLLHQQEAED